MKTFTRIASLAAWALPLLGVVASIFVAWTTVGLKGDSAIQEIDGLVLCCTIMIATYITARAVTGILRTLGG